MMKEAIIRNTGNGSTGVIAPTTDNTAIGAISDWMKSIRISYLKPVSDMAICINPDGCIIPPKANPHLILPRFTTVPEL